MLMSQMELVRVYREETHLQETLPPKEALAKLECKTYGFDCGFDAKGDTDEVVKAFREHTLQEHGIDYPDGVVMKFLSRKY